MAAGVTKKDLVSHGCPQTHTHTHTHIHTCIPARALVGGGGEVPLSV